MLPANPDLLRRLGAVIARCRDEIIDEWLTVVRKDEGASGVPLTDLRDAMPDYLDALREGLLSSSGSVEESGGAAWRSVARHHALTRVRLGFDVAQLVHEFIVLRRILTAVAERAGNFEHSHVSIVADLIEAAITVSVGTYVDARDYDARRQQAATVGFITHELRAPLTACVLALERLRPVDDDDVRAVRPVLERNLSRIRELADSVLESAKVESKPISCAPKKVRLGHLLAEPLDDARGAAQRKGLAFAVEFDPDTEVEVDHELTKSALGNLLDNAVKYTDEGRVTLTVEDRGANLVFHVRDTCHGLSKEELATIFEPFRRGHSKQPGTGLGLAIARRAAVVQGGRLEAESPAEIGCHFALELPKHVKSSQ